MNKNDIIYIPKEAGMQFEFDQAKSDSNKLKHGIDFIEAQKLWEDDDRVEMKGCLGLEPRFLVTGTIDGKHYTACITYRDSVIRIISARRSRKKEVDTYENQKDNISRGV